MKVRTMKKILFQLLLLALVSVKLFAQESNDDERENKYALKFAPAGLAVGKTTVGGEYNLKHHNSLTFYAGFPFDKTRSITYNKQQTLI